MNLEVLLSLVHDLQREKLELRAALEERDQRIAQLEGERDRER